MIYPGYSHTDQAMSELHAAGSPIEQIAPFINHYPLSVLFFGFGLFIVSVFKSRPAKVSGLLIMLHGVATLTAGYFPCDTGCVPDAPSLSHVLHGLSGFVLLLTLLVAPAMWGFISRRELNSHWFRWASFGAVFGQLLFIVPLYNAAVTGENFGLYQRLAYSVPLVWLFALALMLIRKKAWLE
jgi:hypothetical protein